MSSPSYIVRRSISNESLDSPIIILPDRLVHHIVTHGGAADFLSGITRVIVRRRFDESPSATAVSRCLPELIATNCYMYDRPVRN